MNLNDSEHTEFEVLRREIEEKLPFYMDLWCKNRSVEFTQEERDKIVDTFVRSLYFYKKPNKISSLVFLKNFPTKPKAEVLLFLFDNDTINYYEFNFLLLLQKFFNFSPWKSRFCLSYSKNKFLTSNQFEFPISKVISPEKYFSFLRVRGLLEKYGGSLDFGDFVKCIAHLNFALENIKKRGIFDKVKVQDVLYIYSEIQEATGADLLASQKLLTKEREKVKSFETYAKKLERKIQGISQKVEKFWKVDPYFVKRVAARSKPGNLKVKS